MGAAELIIEHRYGSKHLRTLRLVATDQRILTIGSAAGMSLRLYGPDVSGVHAALSHSQEGTWQIVDLGSDTGTWIGSKNIEAMDVKGPMQIQIGRHQLHLRVVNQERILFKQSTEAVVENVNSLTVHEVIVKTKLGVEEVHYLKAGETFQWSALNKKVELPSPASSQWKTTQVGPFTVQQRLTTSKDVIGHEGIQIDQDMQRPAMVCALVFAFLTGIALLLPKNPFSDLALQKPQESQFTKLVYDSSVIQKKREEAKRATQVRKEVSGGGQAGNGAAPQTAQNTSPSTESTSRAISKIRASGLSQLIGKIAVRASKSGQFIVTDGKSASDASTGSALAAIGKATAGGTAAGLTGAGQGFKIGGVKTGGKAGGSGLYKEGTGLDTGRVGMAEVGLVDEESSVEGGLDRDVIADVIRKDIGQIRYCYERQLGANPDLYGKVLVRFSIVPDGTVMSAQVGHTTMNNSLVEGCILRRVTKWVFPIPKGGTTVNVSYPFLFKSLNQ